MQIQQNTFIVNKSQFYLAFIFSLISLFINIIFLLVTFFTVDITEFLGGATVVILVIQIIANIFGVICYSKDMVSTKHSKMYAQLYLINFGLYFLTFIIVVTKVNFNLVVQIYDGQEHCGTKIVFQSTVLIIWILVLCFMSANLVVYCKVAFKIKKLFQQFKEQNQFLNLLNYNNKCCHCNNNCNNNGYCNLQQSIQQYQAPTEGIPLIIEQRPSSLVVQGQVFTQNQQQMQQYQHQKTQQQFTLTTDNYQNTNFQNYQQL